MGRVRVLVDDLFRVRQGVYWTDLTITLTVAWTAFWLAAPMPWSEVAAKALLLLLSAFAFFRGLIFIHEIVHIGRDHLVWFRYAWTAFCGTFFFLPDYIYSTHGFHHRVSTFSTKQDPEYVPVAHQHLWELLAPLLLFPVVPLVLAVRFLVLGPVSLVVGGRFREALLRNASTLKMNPQFEWTSISVEERQMAARGDLVCATGWILFLAACHWWLHRQVIAEWYVVTYLVFTINHVRSLARHRYTNASSERVDYESQILDSITISGFSPLAWVFMPVGLRYHSIHHMFPRLPYHSLGEAHRRLLAALPNDHLYRKTLEPHFSGALINVLRSSKDSTHSSDKIRQAAGQS